MLINPDEIFSQSTYNSPHMSTIINQIQSEHPIFSMRSMSGETIYVVTRHNDVSRILVDENFTSAHGTRIQLGDPENSIPSVHTTEGCIHKSLRDLSSTLIRRCSLERLRFRFIRSYDLCFSTGSGGGQIEYSKLLNTSICADLIAHILSLPEALLPSIEMALFADYTNNTTGRNIYDVICREILQQLPTNAMAFQQIISLGDKLSIPTNKWLSSFITVIATAIQNTVPAVVDAVTELFCDRRIEIATAMETDIHGVCDELFRIACPVLYMCRTAKQAQLIHDVRVPANARLCLMIHAANRDERAFPVTSNLLDIPDSGRHSSLAFGKGAHSCLGSAVARNILGSLLKDRLADLSIRVERRSQVHIVGNFLRRKGSVVRVAS